MARGIVAFLGYHEMIGLTTFAVNLLVSCDRGWNGLRDIFLRAISGGTSGRRGSGNGVLHHLPRGRQGCLGLWFDDRRRDFLPELYPTALLQPLGVPCAVGVLVAVAVALTLFPAVLTVGSRFGLFEPKRKSTLAVAADRHGDRAVARTHSRRDISSHASRAIGAAGIQAQLQRSAVSPQRYSSQSGMAAAARHFPQSR